MVRDLIRVVQNLRKESGLEVSDRIALYVEAGPELIGAVEMFEEYLANETLAEHVYRETGDGAETYEIAGEDVKLALERVG